MAITDKETTTTTPTSGGRITDELRHYIEGAEQLYGRECKCLTAIADRIDASHEKAIASVMNDALYHANDKDMADLGWILLPKDADGECIHVGDVMESGDGDVFVVSSVDYGHHSSHGDGEFWMLWSEDADFYERADECRHYHAPTVEDVLDEFVERWHDTHHDDIPALKAEYAAKLQLRGDAE